MAVVAPAPQRPVLPDPTDVVPATETVDQTVDQAVASSSSVAALSDIPPPTVSGPPSGTPRRSAQPRVPTPRSWCPARVGRGCCRPSTTATRPPGSHRCCPRRSIPNANCSSCQPVPGICGPTCCGHPPARGSCTPNTTGNRNSGWHRLKDLPAATADHRAAAPIRIGEVWSVIVPSPRAPAALLPQHHREPSARIPQV